MEATDEPPVREGYAAWAFCYDNDGNPLTALEGPAMRRWFGPIEGRKGLDLGCGPAGTPWPCLRPGPTSWRLT